MASSKQGKLGDRVKKLQQARKRLDRKTSNIVRLPSSNLSSKEFRRLEKAHELIYDGRFQLAQQELEGINTGRSSSNPDVLEALMEVYQELGNHDRCCEVAERLTVLRPNDPLAKVIFAQELMFCNSPALALVNYREFVAHWPDHEFATRAQIAIETVAPVIVERIEKSNFPIGEELDCLLLQEQCVRCIQFAEFARAERKCRELISKAPSFVPARNNLALACFHSGRIEEAVRVVEATHAMDSRNQFAAATLAKLYYLTGRFADANCLADEFQSTPDMNEDAHVAQVESLAYLGRDADIVALVSSHQVELDPSRRGIQQHLLAYAQCRLGDERTARATWKACCRIHPHPAEVEENLADLEASAGHAPWPFSIVKWIPKSVLDGIVKEHERQTATPQMPKSFAALIPTLLDRGDPQGRELAVCVARLGKTPEQLEALKVFTLGRRGPDAMRMDCQRFLITNGVMDAGPQRMYSHGRWIDAQSFTAEIFTEPRPSKSSPWVLEAITEAVQATNAGKFDQAEALYDKVLAAEPENLAAAYNQCAVWMGRDGARAQPRIRARVEQIHAAFPDYVFARIAVAQFAALNDNDVDRARQLVEPVLKSERMHIDEAKALFVFQAQLAIHQRDFAAANLAKGLLKELVGHTDPVVMALESELKAQSQKQGLFPGRL